MAISNLNPVRLISFEFKAPAPSIVRRPSLPSASIPRGIDARTVDRTGFQPEATIPAVKPRPIEPMLLLHQEQAETIRLVLDAVSRAIRPLTGRTTRA